MIRIIERATGRDEEPARHASPDGITPVCASKSRGGYYEVTYPATRPAGIGDVDCKRCRKALGDGREVES